MQTTAMYLHTDEQQLQRIAGLSEFPPESSKSNKLQRIRRSEIKRAGFRRVLTTGRHNPAR
jgi:hypothetical protein